MNGFINVVVGSCPVKPHFIVDLHGTTRLVSSIAIHY
jgi:hypothetical protein